LRFDSTEHKHRRAMLSRRGNVVVGL
jgi:hypothetical protein